MSEPVDLFTYAAAVSKRNVEDAQTDAKWIAERLRDFNDWPRMRDLNCADGFCGADDCATCHPSARRRKPYDDSREPGYDGRVID